MKRTGYWLLWLGLLALALGAGCTVKNKGVAHENSAPRVFFSTVPVAGTVFTKPDQFFWFALDKDGYIIEFQYALIPDSPLIRLASAPPGKEDSVVRAFLKARPVDSDTIWHWVSVDNIQGNGQTDTIALPTTSQFASDTATRNSVVFVRARDDRQALSTDPLPAAKNAADSAKFDLMFAANPSAIAWRHFGRKNRPPRTHFRSIGVCNKSPISSSGLIPTFYTRDFNTYDTSAFMKVGHCGITIEWFGSDSADYPNQEQPPLDYFWELYGPFPSSQTAGAADTTKLWASSTYPIRYPGTGPTSRRTFTSATSVTFFGLRGFDTLTNFRSGFYHFRVRARDDANVVSPLANASTNTFRVFYPQFDRDILLAHKATFSGGLVKLVPPYGLIPDGSTPPQESVLVQNYYLKLIRDAGYAGRIDSARDVKFFGQGDNVPESLLARYKLVIFHKERNFPSSGLTNFLASLKAYMDAGGSVWGLGRNDLSDLGASFDPPEIFFSRFDPVTGVGYYYFGAEKMYYPAHHRSVAVDSVSFEEFVGADPTGKGEEAGLPPIDIDTNVILRYTVAAPPRKDTSRYREMPGVNYFVPGPRAEALYLFRSPIGVADTSHLNGKAVAIRSNRTFFRSAYFGFSLYGIKEEHAVLVMQKMLTWFIGPP